jgi:hypothetical protein
MAQHIHIPLGKDAFLINTGVSSNGMPAISICMRAEEDPVENGILRHSSIEAATQFIDDRGALIISVGSMQALEVLEECLKRIRAQLELKQ